MLYALEFWQQHILAYAANGGDVTSDTLLFRALIELWSTHGRISEATSHKTIGTEAVAKKSESISLDTRLQLIANLPVSTLVCETLQLRLSSEEEVVGDGKGKGLSHITASLV